jgi:hypothetical protein
MNYFYSDCVEVDQDTLDSTVQIIVAPLAPPSFPVLQKILHYPDYLIPQCPAQLQCILFHWVYPIETILQSTP